MNKKHFYAVVILLLFLAAGIQPALAISIPGDDSYYDVVDSTYILKQNISETITIVSDGITLDGAGYTVTAVGNTGVFFNYKQDVTIRNLNVTGCVHGICLQNSSNNILTDNTVSGNKYGITLYNCRGDTLTTNKANNNTNYGIELSCSYDYTLTGNTVSENVIGIYLYGCNYPIGLGTLTNNIATNNSTGIQLRYSSNNIVTGNTVSSNSWGIRIRAYDGETSIENQVYNNNFENTPGQQAEVSGSEEHGTGNIDGNVFNQDLPIGGNYWSDWDPETDPNYVFTGGQDNEPWAVKDGWLDTTPPIISCPGNTAIVGPDGVPVDDERIQTFLNGASATDNCDPEPTITYSPLPDIFPPGDTIVTFTATDASGNLSSCSSTVAVVDTEGHLRIIPSIINREGRLEKILAVIRFPEGTTEEDIDIGQPLILYPGESLDGIQATRQRIIQRYRRGTLRVSVFASFSKDEVTADVPDGPVEMMVIGRFDDSADGEYFYGFDNVWIISWHWPCW